MRRLCTTCRTPYSGKRCADCAARWHKRTIRRTGTSAQKGYGHRWRVNARAFLAENPICVLCGDLARVADHWPVPRRELAGVVDDPDAWHRLRPLCMWCDARWGRR